MGYCCCDGFSICLRVSLNNNLSIFHQLTAHKHGIGYVLVFQCLKVFLVSSSTRFSATSTVHTLPVFIFGSMLVNCVCEVVLLSPAYVFGLKVSVDMSDSLVSSWISSAVANGSVSSQIFSVLSSSMVFKFSNS